MAVLDRALSALTAAIAPGQSDTWGWGRWDGTHVILEDDPDATPLIAENATGRLTSGQRVFCRVGNKRATIIGPEAPAPGGIRGSNANGHWWRDPSGVQICWVEIQGIGNTNPYASLHLASSLWTFPAPFAAAPAVTCGRFQLGSGAAWPASSVDITALSARVRAIDAVARPAGTPVYIQAAAVGLWR